MDAIICRDCKKKARDLLEYQTEAKSSGVDVDTWVRGNDGMYDAKTNTVVCTPCYAKGIIAGRYV